MVYLLHHIIEETANRFPDKEAYKFKNESITYSQLVEKANQLAFLLIDLGTKRGDRVGIYMNRCLETAIAIYGIMKAGGVYVPLNPASPLSQIAFTIKDCTIDHIVTTPQSAKSLEPLFAEKSSVKNVIGFQADWDIEMHSWEGLYEITPPDISVNILEQDLAYIMYTSGTTGKPKGIMHTHHSGLRYAMLSADLYDLQPSDRVGSHASIHFDVSTFGYFTAPFAGASTVIIPDAHTKLPVSLAQLIEKEKLSVWYSVVLPLLQILQSGAIDQCDFNTLRWVLFCGEPFPVKHLRSLMNKWPNATFSNVYGPAEVNQCTYYHLSSQSEVTDAVPLGKAWGNTELLILDDDQNMIEEEGTGELLVRSETMMRGYWGNKGLTEKSLYSRRFSDEISEVFYKTGDLVKLMENGELLFLGRKDRQVKIRGYRIELDGLEAVIVQHPQVAEAAVYATPENQPASINAIIIQKEDSENSKEDIKTYLKDRLPAFSIPENIFFVEEIPRTDAGKVDYKELLKI